MHTPGPWHVGGVGGCRPQIIYSPTGLAVLRTWGVATQAEEEANAHLAAAAPDLLDAVKDAYRELSAQAQYFADTEGRINPENNLFRILRKIESVIAKAKGEI